MVSRSGIGKIRLDRLRVSDVQSWLNKLQSQCQCCAQGKDAKRAARDPTRAKCCAKGECCRSYPSGRTIKDLRGVLRSALSSAMTEELVSRNVATMVKAPRLRPRKIVPWSSEEARRFLESARNDDDSLYAAFVLVLVLGLRKGEVLGLSWPAVDVMGRELTIDQQLQRVRRELLLRQTKTAASDSTLPIPDLVATALELRRTAQEKEKAEAGEIWRGLPQGPHLVFTGRLGTPVDPRTLNRRFTARCDLAGLRHMTVHDARRTRATLLVDVEVHRGCSRGSGARQPCR